MKAFHSCRICAIGALAITASMLGTAGPHSAGETSTTEITIDASGGIIEAPFFRTNDYIYQKTNTDISTGGKAVYSFNVVTAGHYYVQGLVSASNEPGSFFTYLDADPMGGLYMVWPIHTSTNFETQTLSWVGNGTLSNPEIVPVVFDLGVGKHHVIVVGRGSDTKLKQLSLHRYVGEVQSQDLQNILLHQKPQQLFEQLKSDNATLRRSAALLLGNMDLRNYSRELAEALASNDLFVRFQISIIITKMGARAIDIAPAILGALKDEDSSVRSNSASVLGNIGPQADFAIPALIATSLDYDEGVRFSAIDALKKIHVTNPQVVAVITNAFTDRSASVREAAYEAAYKIPVGSMAISPLIIRFSHVNGEERTHIAQSIANIAVTAQDAEDKSALPPLRKAQEVLAAAGYESDANYLLIKAIAKSLSYLPVPLTNHETSQKVLFGVDHMEALTNRNLLTINGADVDVSFTTSNQTVFLLLGNTNILHLGVNDIGTSIGNFRQNVRCWFEANKLETYPPAYKKSYAIIVAIDDYDRKRSRGKNPSGLPQLENMVSNAKILCATIKELGFPSSNIFELYDSNATSQNITTMLERFWEGNDCADCDRLFFYFGGHGETNSTSSFLVTYDFDPKRPTTTSFLLKDFRSRHFDNVTARHFFIAIDACCAGEAAYLGDDRIESARLSQFRTLSIIQTETEKRARNMLLAGTGDQRAGWDHGGIFTRVLIDGLQGKADYDHNGVIEFDELRLYVKKEVAIAARKNNEIQVPQSWRDDSSYGNIVFIMNSKQ